MGLAQWHGKPTFHLWHMDASSKCQLIHFCSSYLLMTWESNGGWLKSLHPHWRHRGRSWLLALDSTSFRYCGYSGNPVDGKTFSLLSVTLLFPIKITCFLILKKLRQHYGKNWRMKLKIPAKKSSLAARWRRKKIWAVRQSYFTWLFPKSNCEHGYQLSMKIEMIKKTKANYIIKI